MTNLVALVSSGKGTWGDVTKLINSQKWSMVYLICTEFAYKHFEIDQSKAIKVQFFENDYNKSLSTLSKFFKTQIKDFEVAVNLTSGTGNEHMLILSALLKAGLGTRFVYIDNKQVKEFEILDEDYSIFSKEDEDITF